MNLIYNNVHLFGIDEIIYIKYFLDLISDNPSVFGGDNYVVTTFERVSKELEKQGYHNYVYFPSNNSFDHNVINHFCAISRRVFVHAMPPISDAIFIRNKYCKKIVWRSWGHDVGYDCSECNFKTFKNSLRVLVEKIWARKVKKFKFVGIANVVDYIDITRRFGKNINTVKLHYSSSPTILTPTNTYREKESHETINVMVGHSGHSEDNHLSIIKSLEHFGTERIHIHLVLVYGNERYITNLIESLKDIHLPYTLYTELMPLQEYNELLESMDVVVLDGKKSYALGNLSFLMKRNKKIILNREGILHQALDYLGVYHGYTDTLKEDTIEELLYNEPVPLSAIQELGVQTREECIASWSKVLNS